MFYAKNLPGWERALRLFSGLFTVLCGVHFWGTPVGIFFLIAGIATGLTAVLGFCPMCALAGRKLEKAVKNQG